ncbi:MAG TPA: hypothetical protein VHB79_36305 [Polyangiaceae bacterium]|nr:hypothetical protein [Polyangiaceae bacterium]
MWRSSLGRSCVCVVALTLVWSCGSSDDKKKAYGGAGGEAGEAGAPSEPAMGGSAGKANGGTGGKANGGTAGTSTGGSAGTTTGGSAGNAGASMQPQGGDSLGGSGNEVAMGGDDAAGNGGAGGTQPCIGAACSPLGYALVSTAQDHVCAIRNDQSLWCWGGNGNGQLGDGSNIARVAPARVGRATWSKVVASYYGSCGLQTDGSLWCWGLDQGRRLGNGRLEDQNVPTRVGDKNDQSWSDVTLGDSHACALHQDGSLWCWGLGNQGQLGGNVTGTRALPTRVGNDTWLEIKAGGASNCGRKQDGSLWCWGRNDNGQAGVAAVNPVKEPTQIGKSKAWTQLSLGDNHACAIDSNHDLYCWGDNGWGQLGNGAAPTDSPTPVQIGAGASWASVDAGYSYTCATRSDGTAWCWGNNDYGVLGKPGAPSSVPQQVDDTDTWSSMSASPGSETCGIRKDYSLWCWGYGPLGNGDPNGTAVDTPSQVPGNPCTDVSDTCQAQQECNFVQGQGVTCRCAAGYTGANCDDIAECAGNVCGVRTTCDEKTPGFDCSCQSGFVGDGKACGPKFAALAVGANNHSCGIDTAQQLWCWGDNQLGQLGTGDTNGTLSAKHIGAAAWLAVDMSQQFSCGIQADHTLWCWGTNGAGRSGQPANVVNETSPTQVGTDKDWLELSVGEDHGCARKQDNSIWCWGSDSQGALGINLGTGNIPPTQVGNLKTWTKVTAGDANSCGLRSDHSLWCWGYNGSGQMAQPAANPIRVMLPAPITGPAGGWQDVSIYDHTCGVGVDGTLWCWGLNDKGQLGIGNGTTTEVVTQVGTDTDWVRVSSGLNQTCALKSNGSIWCWGGASYGNLGGGSDIYDLFPRRVGFIPGFTAPRSDGFVAYDWVQVDVGYDATCALRSNGSAWCWGNGFNGVLGSGDSYDHDLPVLVR